MTDQTPVVLMTPFELLRAAQGHPMRTSIAGGGEVIVRVPTVDELLDLNRQARAAMEAKGIPVPPPITRDEAERLLR